MICLYSFWSSYCEWYCIVDEQAIGCQFRLWGLQCTRASSPTPDPGHHCLTWPGLVAPYCPHPATAVYCFNAWWLLPFRIQSNVYSVAHAVFILTSQWAWYEILVLGLENLYSIIFLAAKKGWDRWIIPQSKVQPADLLNTDKILTCFPPSRTLLFAKRQNVHTPTDGRQTVEP
jgi:hypothetical protein